MITGHSARGFGNADDYVHRYLKACVFYGRCLDRPERLDMTPVDYVSRAIVALLLDAPGGRRGPPPLQF
jgi:thioester reductase-like protein